MAVSISSDLIADVMRNADPSRMRAATAALQNLQVPEGDQRRFAAAMDEAGSTLPSAMAGSTAHTAAAKGAAEPFVDFERMVLRNLFESLLPGPESGAFGSGPSAGVWRSLAADQLAGVYASAGGIGIASTLAAGESGGEEPAQWPYFTTTKIEAFTG